MKNPGIIRLATGEVEGPIHVGRIPRNWADRLGVSDRWVKLSYHTLGKQVARHGDIELGYYDDIDWVLEHGEVITDPKPHVLHFVGDTAEVYGYRTKVTVKATRSQNQLYMTSAHKLRDRDYKRYKRKAMSSKR